MKRRASPRRRGAKRSRIWPRLLAVAGLLLLVGAAAAGGLWSWSRGQSVPGEPLEFRFEAGTELEALCAQLSRAGIIGQPKLFGWYLQLTRASAALQPGVHLLRPGLSPAALSARLTRSRARPSVKLTIPEGYNQFQIAERLRERDVAPTQAFLAASRDAALLAELGIPAASAEGYLFPATYDLYVDSDPAQVLRLLAKEMSRRYRVLAERHAAPLRQRELTSGWGMHQFITLASIVEKEAGAPEEDGNIASVFFNRLDDANFRPKQMLQSDPTAGYGCLLAREQLETCASYTGIVTPAMLRDAANLYNTYKHPGLPPGPIANPSEAALEAVMDPPDTPYFFFVAGPGKRHVFSRSFGEHVSAIGSGGAPVETGALPGASLH